MPKSGRLILKVRDPEMATDVGDCNEKGGVGAGKWK
jgi:hypothetical protein